jgi:hypothetical protein
MYRIASDLRRSVALEEGRGGTSEYFSSNAAQRVTARIWLSDFEYAEI